MLGLGLSPSQVATRRVFGTAATLTSWTPAALPNIVAWYDFSDTTKMTVDGSNNVSAVVDKINGLTATASGTAMPKYSATGYGGKPAITFNGSSQFLSFPTNSFIPTGASPLSIGAVAKSSSAGDRVLMTWGSTGTGNWAKFAQFGAAPNQPQLDFYSTDTALGYTDWTTGVLAVTMTSSPAITIGYDSGQVGTSSNLTGSARSITGSNGFIGQDVRGGNYWSGPMQEIVVMSSAMSPSDRLKWEGYCYRKWGTPIPTTHLYYNTAPVVENRNGAQSTSSYAFPSYVYNATTANTKRLRAARANVVAGTASARFVWVGDSQMMGAGAGDGAGGGGDTSNTSNAFQYALAQDFASAINTAGVPAVSNSLFGTSNSPIAYGAYDGRAVLNNFGANTGNPTLAGTDFTCTTSGGTFTFIPNAPVSSFGIPYSGGNFTVSINGTVTAPVADTGGIRTYNCTRGTPTIVVATTSSAACVISGFICHDSAPKLELIQASGWGEPASTATYGLPQFRQFNQDVVIIGQGGNDISAGDSPAGVYGHVTQLVLAAQNGGAADVILAAMPSQDPSKFSRSEAYQKTVWDAVHQVANEQQCVFVSYFEMFGGFAAGNAAGLYWDYVHQKRSTQITMANVVRDVWLNL